MVGNFLKLFKYARDFFTYQRKLSILLGVDVSVIRNINEQLYHSAFMDEMREKNSSKGNFFDLNMLNPMRGPVLYTICKLKKPDIVVETGVANGFSSSFILRALSENNSGKLFSIDLPNQPGEEISNEVGWLIPQSLRSRWELIIGNSRDKLPELVDRCKYIDVFYHDSNHNYENILFEMNTVWQKIREQGILVADDVTMNNAFSDFLRDKQLHNIGFYRLGISKKQ